MNPINSRNDAAARSIFDWSAAHDESQQEVDWSVRDTPIAPSATAAPPEFTSITERAAAPTALAVTPAAPKKTGERTTPYEQLHQRLLWIETISVSSLVGAFSKVELTSMLRSHSIYLRASVHKTEVALEVSPPSPSFIPISIDRWRCSC